MQEDKRIAESLDPSAYAVHVTKTAMLLEQLARDVKALREQTDHIANGNGALRESIGAIEKDVAVFKVATNTAISTNQDAIKELAEKLRWLSRLVLGALITGVLGGGIALLFRIISP